MKAGAETNQQQAGKKKRGPSQIWEMMSWVCVLALLAYLILAIPQTLDWKLIHDAPLMHYMSWLILEGAVPYRDIFDMNMPVTYLIHAGVLLVLGDSDEAWRYFDLGWLAITYLTIIIYCKRQGWLSAVTAATLFACFHIAGGEMMSGQRDFLMAPFLILGGHFTSNVLENKHRMIAALMAGIFLGIAFWIKPYAVMFFIVLFLYAKIQSRSIFVSLLMALGFLIPAGGVGAYLFLNQALLPWWEIVGQYLIPIYSTIGPDITPQELSFSMLSSLAILLPFLALSTPLTGRFFVSLVGVLYGVGHYLLQKKGLSYHLSPLFLWASIFAAYRIGSNIKAPRTAPRFASLAGILAVCILASPLYLMTPQKLRGHGEDSQRAQAIYNDLAEIVKPGDLVQVMDHTSGGIAAIHRLRAKPPTRFIRDFQFFTATEKYFVQKLEDEFIRKIRENPPKVILITSQSWPDETRGFGRINDSPALVGLLQENYHMTGENSDYRIYLRR